MEWGTARRVTASLVVMGLAAGSIAALLAELYGVAAMRTVVLTVTVPASLLLVAVAWRPRPRLGDLADRIRVGAVGGLLGTIGYDVVRIPFALAGMRVFAPVHSYGVLAAGTAHSTGWTDTLGWLYHLSNGVTFGIVYALVAARRSRWFGVAWGLILESAAVFGPFAGRYGLSGQTFAIVVAYAAHVAYGYPLGLVVERFDAARARLSRVRFGVTAALLVPAALVVLAFRPWVGNADRERATALAAESGVPTAVVVGTRFQPEWLRIRAGECVDVVNEQDRSFDSAALGPVAADATVRWCPPEPKVHRVRLDGLPFSGGFVYVSP